MSSVFADQERMARFFAVASTLSSAQSLEEFLRRVVHAARSLAHADAVTLELFGSHPPQVIAAGHVRRAATVALERELVVAERPYAVLRLSTTRCRFSPQEEALVDLLCLHAEIGIEKAALREREDVLERVRALLGEAEASAALGVIRELGDVTIDLARYEVLVGGAPVHLTPSEFRLLELLTEQPGRAYSRDEITSRLWNGDYTGSSRVADAHVARLRRKVERDPRHPERLQHVRGVGYRFVPSAG